MLITPNAFYESIDHNRFLSLMSGELLFHKVVAVSLDKTFTKLILEMFLDEIPAYPALYVPAV